MNVKYEGKEVELPEGSTGRDLADKLNLREPHQALAIEIEGKLCDLTHPLPQGAKVRLLSFEDKEGKEVFWHTSAHILAQAILRLYPNAKPTIGPAIDNGFYYDFANLELSDEDFKAIEKEVQSVIKENYRPERKLFKDRSEALKAFSGNPYKVELIEGFDEGEFTAYQQGEFFDLCRGPHLPALGKVKAFKVMKTSGAYWRGDSSREMLTRIYGISFPDKESLKNYLHRLEEAKKRDHKILGQKLDLYSFHEEAPGMPFFHPKGMTILETLRNYWRAVHKRGGYVEISTPQMMVRELWERSGHWANYRENMYVCEVEGRDFAIKPMSCPGGMLYYKTTRHSYREFPLRVSEIGHVHRFEPSGAINGLFRVRSFHQDDAHIFMTPAQIREEILRVLSINDELLSPFGLEYRLELSTRPAKSIGTDAEWEHSTASLKAALDETGRPYAINEGDGAFYGPKIDIHIKDALGRSWQCGTIQLDMSLPERFDLEYMDADGQNKRPVMIHRALYGSFERFFGILVEHYAGRFPLWLSPRQIRVLSVADRHAPYALEVAKALDEAGFLVETDLSNESVGRKVRDAQLEQVNYMLTVGDAEMENGTIAVRTREGDVRGETELKTFIEEITHEKNRRL